MNKLRQRFHIRTHSSNALLRMAMWLRPSGQSVTQSATDQRTRESLAQFSPDTRPADRATDERTIGSLAQFPTSVRRTGPLSSDNTQTGQWQR